MNKYKTFNCVKIYFNDRRILFGEIHVDEDITSTR